jgi:hypothetical protein
MNRDKNYSGYGTRSSSFTEVDRLSGHSVKVNVSDHRSDPFLANHYGGSSLSVFESEGNFQRGSTF